MKKCRQKTDVNLLYEPSNSPDVIEMPKAPLGDSGCEIVRLFKWFSHNNFVCY